MPTAERTMPSTTVSFIIIVKYLFAFSVSFSPRVFATSELPPVPIINPNPPKIIITGIIKFTAANEVFLT